MCLLWWTATVSLSTDLDRAEQMRWFRSESIVLALITSVASPEQILWVEGDEEVKSLSWGLCFLSQNNNSWKSLKTLEIKCFANKTNATRKKKGYQPGVLFVIFLVLSSSLYPISLLSIVRFMDNSGSSVSVQQSRCMECSSHQLFKESPGAILSAPPPPALFFYFNLFFNKKT